MRTLSFVMLLMFVFGVANAQLISGTTGIAAEGETFVIYGSGFGTKIPATPALWDNFEGHPINSPIASPIYGSYSRIAWTVYSDTSPYSGTRCAFAHTEAYGTLWGSLTGLIAPIGDGEEYSFASMKYKVTTGGVASNVKLFRLNTGYPDPTHGEPNFNIGKERTATSWYATANIEQPPQTNMAAPAWVAGFGTSACPWVGMSIWDHMSTAGVADGSIGWSCNGTVASLSDVITLQSGELFAGPRFALFAEYLSHEGTDSYIYLDNLYADNTLARVEIGNARTYGGGTNLEIQPPTLWNDGSITITFNQGTFIALNNAWVYVTTADGVTGPGFQITIETPTTSEEIMPPSNLNVK